MKFTDQINSLTLDQKKLLLISLQRKYLPEEEIWFETLTDGSMIDTILAFLLADGPEERQQIIDHTNDEMLLALKNCERVADKVALFDLELQMITSSTQEQDFDTVLSSI
jgi:hypothetical protein